MRGADKFAGIFWTVIAVIMIIVGFTSINVGNKGVSSGVIEFEKMSATAKYLYASNLQTAGIAILLFGGLILLALHVSGQFDKIDYRFKKIEEYHAYKKI